MPRFLSTLSLRRATRSIGCLGHPQKFLSTLSLRRATRIPQDQLSDDGNFYPRSPCGERRSLVIKLPLRSEISIHALLAESDTIFAVRPYDAPIFLSTLSLRRATCCHHSLPPSAILFLSTLSLRRATYLVRGQRPNWGISIHALLAESDAKRLLQPSRPPAFLSTLSLRRATRAEIHASSQQEFLSTLSLRRATETSSR